VKGGTGLPLRLFHSSLIPYSTATPWQTCPQAQAVGPPEGGRGWILGLDPCINTNAK